MTNTETQRNGTALSRSMQRLVRRLFPAMTMTRPESIVALSKLQEKLNESRRERNYWRQRCTDAEALYANQVNEMREAARGKEGIWWRIL